LGIYKANKYIPKRRKIYVEFIDKISEVERMCKALIKSIENLMKPKISQAQDKKMIQQFARNFFAMISLT